MDSVNRLILERVVNSWKSFRHNSVEIYGGSYNAMSGLMVDKNLEASEDEEDAED